MLYVLHGSQCCLATKPEGCSAEGEGLYKPYGMRLPCFEIRISQEWGAHASLDSNSGLCCHTRPSVSRRQADVFMSPCMAVLHV